MRRLVIAVAAAGVLAAGLSGCSGDKDKKESSSPGTSVSVPGGSASVSDAASAKVTIDGKDQNVGDTVVCTTMGGDVNIAIGGAASGIAAVLTDATPPGVKSVGLGNVNGVTLAYAEGSGQGDATASKDGNTYKISGHATGVDMQNPMEPVNKPFEIQVTCK